MRRFLAFCCIAASVVWAGVGCSALVDPDASVPSQMGRPSAVPTTSAVPAASPTALRSPQATPSPSISALPVRKSSPMPLLVSSAELSRLTEQVLRPLVVASADLVIESPGQSVTVQIGEGTPDKLWTAFLYQLTNGETPAEEIFGSAFRRSTSPAASESRAAGSASPASGEPAAKEADCDLIERSALEKYFMDAFGIPVPAVLNEYLSEDGTVYVVAHSDIDIWTENIAEPEATLEEDVGTLELTFDLWTGDAELGRPWLLNADIAGALDSPYGCFITRFTVSDRRPQETQAPAAESPSPPMPSKRLITPAPASTSRAGTQIRAVSEYVRSREAGEPQPIT